MNGLKKKDPPISCIGETHLRPKDTYRWSGGMETDNQYEQKQKASWGSKTYIG